MEIDPGTDGQTTKIRRKTPQPPMKDTFELFMLSTLIFTALGTLKHDAVLYGGGVLIFMLPVFFDPFSHRRRKVQISERERKELNWEMIGAIVAIVALLISILTQYGIIPKA